VEVCAKFGGDWSGGSLVKEGNRYIHRYKQSVLYILNFGKNYIFGSADLYALSLEMSLDQKFF